GIRKNVAVPAASSRGTVEMVVSCNEVSTCTMLTSKLTITAAASTGLASSSTSRIVKRPKSTTCSTGIFASTKLSSLTDKTSHHRTYQQIPPINHHEQQNLERSRNHDRWELQHAHRRRDRGHHHVDDQKRQKQHGADLKAGAQLRK